MTAMAGLTAPDERELLAASREVMRRGSLSFFLAARLAPQPLREAIYLLYCWCREVDDATDLGTGTVNERLKVLEALSVQTRAALAGQAGGTASLGLRAMALLGRRHRLPDHYPLEMLAGMAMDLKGETYPTLPALALYCYRVAGTVGLMFCHLAGVSDPRACGHAAQLGMAMQLSNICRDVKEDAAMGRCYVPPPGDWPTVATLLARAEQLYGSGAKGVRFLPLRAALAVAAALRIYREIGREVGRRGPAGQATRVVIPLRRKLLLAALGVMDVSLSLPRRLFRPWRAVELSSVLTFADLRWEDWDHDDDRDRSGAATEPASKARVPGLHRQHSQVWR